MIAYVCVQFIAAVATKNGHQPTHANPNHAANAMTRAPVKAHLHRAFLTLDPAPIINRGRGTLNIQASAIFSRSYSLW